MLPDTPNFVIKPALMGGCGTGKSKLMLRFTNQAFRNTYTATRDAKFTHHKFSISDEIGILEIWDAQAYPTLSDAQQQTFYKDKDVILIVFDITLGHTFGNLEAWIETLEASETPASKIPKILVGNKLDLQDQRKVTTEDAAAFAAERNMPYFETSAKDGQNVEALLNEAATLGLRYYTSRTQQEQLTPKIVYELSHDKLEPHAALNSLIPTIPDALEKTHLEHLNQAFAPIYSAAANYANTHTSVENYLGSKIWKQSWDEARTIMLDKIYKIDMEKGAKLALIDTAKNMDFFKLHVNTSFQRTLGTPSAIEKLEKWAKELQNNSRITSKFIPSKHARRDNKIKFNTIKP